MWGLHGRWWQMKSSHIFSVNFTVSHFNLGFAKANTTKGTKHKGERGRSQRRYIYKAMGVICN